MLLWLAFAFWVERNCIYDPPAIPPAAAGLAVARVAEGFSSYGESWLHEDTGIQELYLEGDAVTRGRAMANLCTVSLDLQEDQLIADLDRLLPSRVARYFLRTGILFAFRSLPEFVSDDDECAVAAMASVAAQRSPRPADAELPAYHRMLFYQSLYDIGQAMAESGMVDAGIGCTSFAASGPRTAGGGLVFGRNCDFEAGSVFDDRKTVQFIVPAKGKRFVSVAWAGMLGVVSGVNEDGLVIALHAARTERTRRPRVGTPIPLLLRDALLYDRTIEEVAVRLRNAKEHAAAIIVVAEGSSGRSAVIETDGGKAVILPSKEGLTVGTNHFLTGSWAGDSVAAAALTHGSSVPRFVRTVELVARSRGQLDAAGAAAILRDRLGIGGREIGLGNRTAISAFISAHAMVYDAAAGRLLVSRAPHGLGEFVAYDVRRFFKGGRPAGSGDLRVAGPAPVPSSPDLASAPSVDRGRALLRSSGVARRAGDAKAALRDAREAATLLQRTPESLLVLAEALIASGVPAEAQVVATDALGRDPVPGPEVERLTEIAGAPAR